jgi:hypothetical protein
MGRVGQGKPNLHKLLSLRFVLRQNNSHLTTFHHLPKPNKQVRVRLCNFNFFFSFVCAIFIIIIIIINSLLLQL